MVDMFDLLCYALKFCTVNEEGTTDMTTLFKYSVQTFASPDERKQMQNEGIDQVQLWCSNIKALEVRGKEFGGHLITECCGIAQ